MNLRLKQSDQRKFLILPENELAVAAVRKLAPDVKRRRIRVVTLVGPPGCGKSHLARELYRSWEDAHKSGKHLMLTASQFAAQLADASSSGTLLQFQSRHRKDVQLLICEDIHVLGPRKESQQQLLAAIDEIVSDGGVVLVSSTLMPGAIKGLSRRLVNRLHGGLCVNIDLLGAESCRALINQFLSMESLPLSDDEVETITSRAPLSPRELIGLLTQLQRESQLNSGRRSQRTDVGATIAERHRYTSLTVAEIARATANQFGVKISELKGPSRAQSLSLARQTAMYLARELIGAHYVEIGRFFQRGNHSTVIHACQKITRMLEEDSALARRVQSVEDELGGRGG